MSSALSLLEQRCYKEITVLDVVSHSGVNRNTFYYHFKDMPALIESLARRSLDRIFEEQAGSASACLREVLDTLYDNRKLALHVYSSADRNVFDGGLGNLCDYFACRFMETYLNSRSGGSDGGAMLFKVIRGCSYGLISEWLSNGLNEEGKKELHRLADESLKALEL